MIPKILRIPVNAETRHLRSRNPNSPVFRFLIFLHHLETENIESRTVAAEHSKSDQPFVLVFRYHFLGHAGEIGAMTDPAHAGQRTGFLCE